ncbi:MAG TPA: hypothetical protein VEU62_17105, partial [Bryobacterales bacterium]|nr:hypothetical protein [Bryobacterales bacterium]
RYGTLKSIREMVTRSAFTQLRHSWGLVAATLVMMGILFGVPVAGAVAAAMQPLALDPLGPVLTTACGLSLAFMIAAYAPAVRLYQLPVVWALTLPAAALAYAAMTVESALAATFGNGPRWKGRRGG